MTSEITFSQAKSIIHAVEKFNAEINRLISNGTGAEPSENAPPPEVELRAFNSVRVPRTYSDSTVRLRKLQGRYMGYLRNLPLARKSKVKKVFKKEGIRAAIALAKSFR